MTLYGYARVSVREPEAGQWRTGAVRLGVEWLAVGPGRD